MQMVVRCDIYDVQFLLLSVNDPDFKAGVASLAQLLNIPPHPDHLVVLKVGLQNLFTVEVM